MSKIKLPKEVCEALDTAIDRLGNEEILRTHARILADREEEWIGLTWDVLNTLSMIDMARAVIAGYEVELSEDEKILEIYDKYGAGAFNGTVACGAYRAAIRDMLKIQNKKIKGIND